MVTEGFSFCIPVFGTSGYIRDLVLSILSQEGLGGVPHEILIGCDGDVDALPVLRQLADDHPAVRVFYDPVNRGKFITENTLACTASHPFLVFIDSDDRFCTDTALHVIRRYTEQFDLVSFAFRNTEQPGFISPENKGDGIRRVRGGNFCIRRDIFMKINGFPAWRCRADGPFHDRVTAAGYSVTVTDEILIQRLLRPSSLLHSEEYGNSSAIRKTYKKIAARQKAGGVHTLPVLAVNPDLKPLI